MKELNVTESRSLNVIESFFSIIQEFVDKNIINNMSMTSSAIYKNLRKEINVSEDDFVKGFRAAVKSGRITGIESAKKAGYRRIGSKKIIPTAQENTTEEVYETSEGKSAIPSEQPSCEIIIDDNHKLAVLDRHNWGYLKKKDSGNWYTEAYFATTKTMLKGVVQKIIDDQLKGLDPFPLTDLQNKIEQVENSLTDLLEKAIKQRI